MYYVLQNAKSIAAVNTLSSPVTLITKSDQIGDTQYQIGDIFWACIFSDADI